MQYYNFCFQVGVFKVNFAKRSIIHNPSGLKIVVNFLSGGDGWTIDQNYSTKSAKIRNSSGFSQQLSGLFSAEGIHLPKAVSQGKPSAAIPVASTAPPSAAVGARSDSADEAGSPAENDSAVHRSSGQKQQQDSSGKHELVRCSDGHFRLLPKKVQMSNSGKAASEHQALARGTPPPKKRRNFRNEDGQVTECDSRLKQSATKQTPPVARRRLFRNDSEQSDPELTKQETEQKCRMNLKTDRPKTRHNTDASRRQGRGSSPDAAAFAGAHPKSKPRGPVAAPMDNYSGASDDEQADEG